MQSLACAAYRPADWAARTGLSLQFEFSLIALTKLVLDPKVFD